jgi:NAD(P)-dependent dehydrogenase (short-subunit alcohol dehydrogenase family)
MTIMVPGTTQSNQNRSEFVPLRWLRTADDCAKVVKFLLLDLPDYVTGAVIPVDGGLVPGNENDERGSDACQREQPDDQPSGSAR